jgi:hypothetical protein
MTRFSGDSPYAGRSILDLEAERAQLEYQLDATRTQPRSDAIVSIERQLDLITEEIQRAGHSGDRTSD